MDPEDVLEDLEHEVEDAEEQLHSLEDGRGSETTREKQQQAENLLGEIHQQLEFLKDVIDKENE